MFLEGARIVRFGSKIEQAGNQKGANDGIAPRVLRTLLPSSKTEVGIFFLPQ